MIALVLALACSTRADRPVPPHGTLDAVRAAVVDEDAERLRAALDPFRVQENGLREPRANDWAVLVHQAGELANSTRRSERTTAYARFVVTCARCHGGEPVELDVEDHHGSALVALDRAIRHDDDALFQAALRGMARSGGLVDVQPRFLQLAERIADDDRPVVRADALAKLYQHCVRCHGPSSPFKLSDASGVDVPGRVTRPE